MSADGPIHGWPFLIARGRRRGYSVLLASGFLIAQQDYGFLEDIVGPVRDGQPYHAATVTTPRGTRVWLVWSDDPATADGELRDEHSRPLRLFHGFLCTDRVVAEPSSADLAAARAAALDTYRRFLADEARFVIEESVPFAVRSQLIPLPPPHEMSRRATPAVMRRPVGRVTARTVAVLGITVAVIVAVVVVVIVLPSGGQPTMCPPPAPTVITTTVSAVVSHLATPTAIRPSHGC